MFILYCIDKIWYSNYWNRVKDMELSKKVLLSQDFMILYFNNKTKKQRRQQLGNTNTIGPDYSLRLMKSAWLEGKHVFTCFENRILGSSGDFTDDYDCDSNDSWSVGVVIRVFRNNRTPSGLLTDTTSHTQRIYDATDNGGNCKKMTITGPRQGEMSELLRYALYKNVSSTTKTTTEARVRRPLVVIGAGSAINYIIDMLQYCIAASKSTTTTMIAGEDDQQQKEDRVVTILYSTRDIKLFQWAYDTLSSLLKRYDSLNKNSSSSSGSSFQFHLKLAYTGSANQAATKRISITLGASSSSSSSRILPTKPKKEKDLVLLEDVTERTMDMTERSSYDDEEAGLEIAPVAVTLSHNTTPVNASSEGNDEELLEDVSLSEETEAIEDGWIGNIHSSIWFNEFDNPTKDKNEEEYDNNNESLYSIQVLRQRINLDTWIPHNSIVFCQGSATLKQSTQEVCKTKKNVTCYLGRGGS